MDAGRLINMIIHQVMRQVVGRGINAGIDRMSRGKEGKGNSGDMDPGLKQQQRRLKQSMKVGRRVGRF